MRASRGAASTADRHEDEVHALDRLEYFRSVGRNSCDQMRLIGVVDVPPTLARGEVFNPFAGLIEVATLLQDLGAERADRCHLVRVRPNRHDDATADRVELTREGE